MKQYLDISSNFSFYLLLFFLFLINFSIAGCYLILSLLLLQLIINFFISLKKKEIDQWPGLPGYYKYFILFIIFSFVSTLFAVDRLNSLKDNKEFFVFLLIPIYLLIINSKKRLDYSLLTVLASAMVSSLYGILVVAREVLIMKEGLSLDHRLKGLTSHWMTYSGLLMLAFIFFFIYFFFEKRKKYKIALAIALAIILVSILLSLTRSMWVGIFVSLAAFIIIYRRRLLIWGIPALVILILILPGSVKNRALSIIDLDNNTNKDRLFMVQVGVDIFKDYPLTGVGPDNIKKIYDDYKPPNAEHSNPHLHNNFLHILAERGILAFLSYSAALISIFLLLFKKIKSGSTRKKTIAIGVLFVLIGFVIAGMFEYNFGDSEIKFLLFYFLSLPFLIPDVFSETDEDKLEKPED